MYCSHCGKKVTDTMLFCPFCGDPIVIPEQDEQESAAPAAKPVLTESSAELESGASEEAREEPAEYEGEPFVPLNVDELQDGNENKASAGERAPREDDAATELLDWNQSRREYADDVWARRDESGEAFEPLSFEEDQSRDSDLREHISHRKEAASQEKHPPQMTGGSGEPVRLDGVAPKLDSASKGAKEAGKGGRRQNHRSSNTFVPPKPMNPNDIFMDGGDADYDDYDAYDKYDAPEFKEESFAYEDEDEGGFFMRHLRGLVGLAMLVILALMFVIYAFSKSGQLTLAKINLAWSAGAYSQLGDQSFEDGQYALAGQYYERALQRDSDSYSYAAAAAMAYLEVDDTEKASAMLKRCAEINPDSLEPYIYLLNLYPDAAQRPWEVTQLLQQGYQRTGDSRLKVTG